MVAQHFGARKYARMRHNVATVSYTHLIHIGLGSKKHEYHIHAPLTPEKWPDPKAMVSELASMGIKLMVSIWPTIDQMCIRDRCCQVPNQWMMP